MPTQSRPVRLELVSPIMSPSPQPSKDGSECLKYDPSELSSLQHTAQGQLPEGIAGLECIRSELSSLQQIPIYQPNESAKATSGALEKLEQRVQAIESLINELETRLKGHLEAEELCTHSSHGPAQVECQSRRSAISRFKRLLKRALALFYRSRKSRTHSEDSVSLHTESTRCRVMNWIPRPGPSPMSPPGKPPYGDLNSSAYYSAVLEQFEINFQPPLGIVEVMGTEVRPLHELMDTGGPAELTGAGRPAELDCPALLSRNQELIKSSDEIQSVVKPESELQNFSKLPASACPPSSTDVSPLASSAISTSARTMSSNYSPASTSTPSSSNHNASHLDYCTLDQVSMHTSQRSVKESFWSQSQTTGGHAAAQYMNGLSPIVPQSLGSTSQFSITCFPELPPLRSTTYLDNQLWNPPAGIARYSQVAMEVGPSVLINDAAVQTSITSPTDASTAFCDYGQSMWNSPGIVGNQYVSDPNLSGTSSTSPLSVTMSITEDGYSAQDSSVADWSATMQLAGERSMSRMGCYPCQFFPNPGPDQRKKLVKHLNTITHSQTTGQGTVQRFKCHDCGTAYTRKDNLVQHQSKVHARSESSQAVKRRSRVSKARRRKQASVASHC